MHTAAAAAAAARVVLSCRGSSQHCFSVDVVLLLGVNGMDADSVAGS